MKQARRSTWIHRAAGTAGVLLAAAHVPAHAGADKVGLALISGTGGGINALAVDATSGLNTGGGAIPFENNVGLLDCEFSKDGSTAFVTAFDYSVIPVDLSNRTPIPGTPIPVAEKAEDLTLTPDGKYLLVNGFNDNLMSVIRVADRIQVSAIASTAWAAAACDDGSTVLTTGPDRVLNRLSLSDGGFLSTDAAGTSLGRENVYCAKGSKTGIDVGTFEGMQSFNVATLAPVSSLSVGAQSIVFNADSTVVYVLEYYGTVEAYSYDPATGIFGTTPLWHHDLDYPAIQDHAGVEQIALNAAGTRLILTQFGGDRFSYNHNASGYIALNPLTGATISQTLVATNQGSGGACFPPRDDDAAPLATVQFSRSSDQVSEGIGTYSRVDVLLSKALDHDTSVLYSTSGKAANGVDYVALNGSLTIPGGATRVNLPIAIIDDTLSEGTEALTLKLGPTNELAVGSRSAFSLAITDNDTLPTLTLDTNAQSVGESDGFVAVSATLSAPSSKRVAVTFTLSGTATARLDYGLGGARRILIPAGQTSGTTYIPIVNDKLVEGDETLILDFGALSNAAAGAITRQTITIVDND